MQNTSPRFSINWTDILKTLRGTLVTIAGAAIWAAVAFVSTHYQSWSYSVCVTISGTQHCFDLAVLGIPAIGGLVELVRRYLTDHSITAPAG